MKLKKLIGAFAISALSCSGIANAEVDQSLPSYQKASGVSGNLSSVGSDTLANLMTLWAEDFKRYYPNINLQIQAAGSSTAAPALTESTSNLGPMSRKMKDKEREAFEKRFGYPPTAIPVAIDALVVFVNKDNPIKGLSIPQVDAIFSSNRKCGLGKDVNTWGDLGLSGNLASKSFQLFGRNSVSGTYGYFKKHALCKGDFKNSVNEQPGSASVVQGVSESINGIGYSGIGYTTASIRAVPLAKKGTNYVPATAVNAMTGEYPLSRFLYIYVNKAPNKDLPPITAEFIKLVLSKDGQEVVDKDGYVPLPAAVINKQLSSLNLK